MSGIIQKIMYLWEKKLQCLLDATAPVGHIAPGSAIRCEHGTSTEMIYSRGNHKYSEGKYFTLRNLVVIGSSSRFNIKKACTSLIHLIDVSYTSVETNSDYFPHSF